MKQKHKKIVNSNDLTDEERKEISILIRKASTDLDEMYCKIKKSNKILKYRSNGTLINEIYSNILAHFSLLQIIEFSGKSKMVNNEKNLVLNRKQRFEVCADIYKGKFEYLYQQHCEILDSKDEK